MLYIPISLNTDISPILSTIYIEGDYVKSQDIAAQISNHYIKVTGKFQISKTIPNAGNTTLGKLSLAAMPLTSTYFLLCTAQSGVCLAYILPDASVVICNYLGADIPPNVVYYIIGLEWIFA